MYEIIAPTGSLAAKTSMTMQQYYVYRIKQLNIVNINQNKLTINRLSFFTVCQVFPLFRPVSHSLLE